jgi:hypothetical protein
MDDLNEMANLHSAGAIIRHISPFTHLPTHKNANDLGAEFIQKWVVPYYMEIGAYGNSTWIDAIKQAKPEITTDICLLLLGDFNWRTRKVGAYFAAIKGYPELIEIIGTHLLKSEVCYAGHIYALTLAFFNDDQCTHYLNKYLDYYLTQPSLYFDQKYVLEAVLYLDKQNGTNFFSMHEAKWITFQSKQKEAENWQAEEIAKMLGQSESSQISAELPASFQADKKEQVLSTDYFDRQISLLRILNQFSR